MTVTDLPTACLLPDGRRLAWAEWGEPDGVPLVLLHGTPGGRLTGRVNHERYARQGLRVVTPERPGYGGSGGGPHALALAATARRVADRLPDCRFVTWDGVGHAPTPELTAEFLTALLARAL